MVGLIKSTVDAMRDPLISGLIGMFVIAALLVLIIWHKDKCVKEMSSSHDKKLSELSNEISGELKCLNKNMSRQITLLEVLIFKGQK